MNGLIILDKPKGMTSFQAARTVSRILGREKTGHAGTLDPMATGVLPVMTGRATKLLQYLPDTAKVYEAEALFGIRTDTADADGAVVETGGRIPSREEVESALAGFLGKSSQIPPMYSALKQGGVPLYQLARKGQTVERRPREIEIFSAELVSFEEGRAVFRTECSAGTYIRTLAEDIAAKCGTVCHLTALRRLRACGFGIESAVTPGQLEEAAGKGEAGSLMIPPEEIFSAYPEVHVDGRLESMFMNGVDFDVAGTGTEVPEGTRVRVAGAAGLAGIGEVTGGGKLHKLWQSRTAD